MCCYFMLWIIIVFTKWNEDKVFFVSVSWDKLKPNAFKQENLKGLDEEKTLSEKVYVTFKP